MPTIHCQIEEGKSLCGKTKGLSMSLEDFKKEMKSKFFLGECIACSSIVKSKYSKSTKKQTTKSTNQ